MVSRILFSSNSDEWETPQDLYDELDKEFHFNLDLAATKKNSKCECFATDGLTGRYTGDFNIWCNPPYSNAKEWVKRCWELAKSVNVVVMLIPARTDTKWFHEYIYQQPDVEIRFIKGRLKFSGSKNSAPFPSMIIVFRNEKNGK